MTDSYGLRHRAIRRVLLPEAYGKPCPMCGETMHRKQSLDLDHTVGLRIDPTPRPGDRIVHASCNRAWADSGLTPEQKAERRRAQGREYHHRKGHLRGSSSKRGYGAEHKRLRNEWKPAVEAGEVACWRCGLLIQPGAPWHLGHDDDDRTQYRGPEHQRCNTAAAASGKAKRQSPRRRSTRIW